MAFSKAPSSYFREVLPVRDLVSPVRNMVKEVSDVRDVLPIRAKLKVCNEKYKEHADRRRREVVSEVEEDRGCDGPFAKGKIPHWKLLQIEELQSRSGTNSEEDKKQCLHCRSTGGIQLTSLVRLTWRTYENTTHSRKDQCMAIRGLMPTGRRRLM